MTFVLVDTEYTTWPGALESKWSGPGQHREIVQIAALKIGGDLAEEEHLDVLIRPRINPQLSEFFTELTSITQEQVDRDGVSFAQALTQFFAFCGDLPVLCMNSDEGVFHENCRLSGEKLPFKKPWHRLRPFLDRLGVDTKNNSSGDLHKLTPIPLPQGHTHYALHDVRSMAHWLRHAKAQKLFASITDLG